MLSHAECTRWQALVSRRSNHKQCLALTTFLFSNCSPHCTFTASCFIPTALASFTSPDSLHCLILTTFFTLFVTRIHELRLATTTPPLFSFSYTSNLSRPPPARVLRRVTQITTRCPPLVPEKPHRRTQRRGPLQNQSLSRSRPLNPQPKQPLLLKTHPQRLPLNHLPKSRPRLQHPRRRLPSGRLTRMTMIGPKSTAAREPKLPPDLHLKPRMKSPNENA